MISVIVPVYNAEKVLDRCIISILTQTYTNIELLLIDDGSSDNSASICRKYAKNDSRVRFYTKENGGAASARNFGIRVSKGKYIQFVDADDLIDINMIKKMYETLKSKNVDWIICGIKLISLRKTSFNLFGDHTCKRKEEMRDVIIKYYDKAICHSCCNKIYKKELITTMMDETYIYGEDYIFNLNYLKNISSFATVNEALYTYDCRNESVTRGKIKNKEETIKEQFKLSYKLFNEQFDSTDLNSVIISHFFNDLIMNIVYTHSLFRINKSLIYTSVSGYENYFGFLNIGANGIFREITRGNYYLAAWQLKLIRIKYVIKKECKRIFIKFKKVQNEG